MQLHGHGFGRNGKIFCDKLFLNNTVNKISDNLVKTTVRTGWFILNRYRLLFLIIAG